MTNEEKIQYVNFRIKSSKETLSASKTLFENGYWNSCVNRLYYSIFYAVNALLVVNGIQPKTHTSVKSQFSLHFIKTKKLNSKYGRLLNTLYDWRQRGDYENLFFYDKESVEPLLESCHEMIEVLEKEIKNAL